MVPSILCYVLPSVETLDAYPQFLNLHGPTTLSFQTRLTPLSRVIFYSFGLQRNNYVHKSRPIHSDVYRPWPKFCITKIIVLPFFTSDDAISISPFSVAASGIV